MLLDGIELYQAELDREIARIEIYRQIARDLASGNSYDLETLEEIKKYRMEVFGY